MQHYYGAKVIARRLDISESTLFRWIDVLAVPVYLRADKRFRQRRMLYTNEAMLQRWESAMSIDYRERFMAGKEATEPKVIARPSAAQIQRRMKREIEEIASDEPENLNKLAG